MKKLKEVIEILEKAGINPELTADDDMLFFWCDTDEISIIAKSMLEELGCLFDEQPHEAIVMCI